jgi:hypothetical protein
MADLRFLTHPPKTPNPTMIKNKIGSRLTEIFSQAKDLEELGNERTRREGIAAGSNSGYSRLD